MKANSDTGNLKGHCNIIALIEIGSCPDKLPEQQTPAEAAKINLNLNPQNRLKDLIAKSAAQKEIAEGKFAVHLGKRVQHVNIINEKDCIRVIPKGWLDKQVWKEINDILRVHQFAWLSNGKDSCWIKMSN